jgi:rhodanese-related sulfurtransferase
MKHLVCTLLLASLLAGCTPMKLGKTKKTCPVIVHSVFFTLQHEAGSSEEAAFFAKAQKLVAIPGVENFQVLKEVSPKNPYRFGFSMEFADQADYDGYNTHPDHVSFVQDVWMKEVAEFQEIDYVASATCLCCVSDKHDHSAQLNESVTVIDVRTAKEFESGHLKEAINIPYTEMAEKIVDHVKDKDQGITVYCRSGRRSGIAKKTLESMGYTSVTNAGGYAALKKEEDKNE